HYPIVVGFRRDRQDPWLRRFYSWGYNVLIRWLLGTGVRDCDCALKIFRREALAGLLPQSTGFFVNAEMMTRARQLGYGVAEVGVRHRRRHGGVSKVSIAEILKTLRMLVPFWWSEVVRKHRGPACSALLMSHQRVTIESEARARKKHSSLALRAQTAPPATR